MTPKTNVNLVYYIGAGASRKPLPLVSCVPARMRKLADELGSEGYKGRVRQEQRGTLEQLVESLEGLAGRADACPSIDVLAKLHHLRGERRDLRTLKTTLSAFFMIEEGRQRADPRYGHFFAYMADRDARNAVAMPTNVRVISWNYDHQFEKSFAEFTPESDYHGRRSTGAKLQVVPRIPDEYDPSAFSILKLNGSAGARVPPFRNSPPRHNPDLYTQPPDLDDALFLALRFCENVASEELEPYIQFAWEDDTRRSDILELVDRFAPPVDTVVVIGYSFPAFNRDLDRRLFDALRPSEVFLQVAGDSNVRDRIVGLGVSSDKIRVVEDREQFFIPHSSTHPRSGSCRTDVPLRSQAESDSRLSLPACRAGPSLRSDPRCRPHLHSSRSAAR